MNEKDKEKIYKAARDLCNEGVWGWDAEIEENLDEIVDDVLIPVIEGIFKPSQELTEKHLARLQNLIELVEDEWGEYYDLLCEELLEFVRSHVEHRTDKK